MAIHWTLGARLAAGAGILGATAAVVVGVSHLTSTSGDESGVLGGGLASSIASPVTGLPSEGVDYNCALPGTGVPWLEYLPGETPPGMAGGDLPGSTAVRPALFRSTIGPAYRLSLPLDHGPGGIADATGAVDFARVYSALCAVHPDLGGSGLRPLTSDERGLLAGPGTDTEPGMGACACCWIPKRPGDRDDCWTSSLSVGDYTAQPHLCDVGDIWACSWSPPAAPVPSGASAWEEFLTDGLPGLPLRLYWLPPLPTGLSDALSRDP